uniref:OrfY n=1 Tax=uncultured bacterium BAC10-10 TaxID=333372 RepID=Q4JIP8_9BACT|nr:OrfY [uncultured bacterium BAC10-10]
MNRVLIAGVSTRAAAASAVRAGLAVTAIDAFADLDHHKTVRVVPMAHPYSAHAAARAARDLDCDSVVYLSNFENHPSAIAQLTGRHALWGNPPTTVRRVRDPMLLAEVLRRRGFATPDVRLTPGTTSVGTIVSKRWLVKPLASGGGLRIRPWDGFSPLPRASYLQEFVEGSSGSVVFVAANGRAVPLGISRQLVGEPVFGAGGYQYCGSIFSAVDDPQSPDGTLAKAAGALAQTVSEEFGLVGVNGIDFVARAGIPYAVEVNPRWCASMEMVERACGFSVFAAHASACIGGTLPAFGLPHERRFDGAVGKAVVYARSPITVGDTRVWLTEDANIGDIPQPGEDIPAGRPVCTVFATGSDDTACHHALVERAAGVYAQIKAWNERPSDRA